MIATKFWVFFNHIENTVLNIFFKTAAIPLHFFQSHLSLGNSVWAKHSLTNIS